MNLRKIAKITGFIGNGKSRLKRLLSFAVVSLFVMISTSIFSGILIHMEISSTYSQNYNTLKEAGFSDVITAPDVIRDRIDFLLILAPLLGIGLVLPLYGLAVSEICKMYEEHENEEKTKPKKVDSS